MNRLFSVCWLWSIIEIFSLGKSTEYSEIVAFPKEKTYSGYYLQITDDFFEQNHQPDRKSSDLFQKNSYWRI